MKRFIKYFANKIGSTKVPSNVNQVPVEEFIIYKEVKYTSTEFGRRQANDEELGRLLRQNISITGDNETPNDEDENGGE